MARSRRTEAASPAISPRKEARSTVAPKPAIVVDAISKRFTHGDVEVRALNAASLTVNDGEFVAVMGPSGSGKSTLLGLIAGLDLPSEGTIHVHGECVTSMSDDQMAVFRRRHIGFVYQHFNLLADLTVEENVGAPLMLDGCKKSERKSRVDEALDQVGLLDRRSHLPATLSGGELQRAAIARALVVKPAILLADEPTGNLDSASSERVLLDMRRAVDDLGRTILMVTHNQLAAAYADRTVELLDGTFQRP
jgi:putative ABC transport system ATP-binding protein